MAGRQREPIRVEAFVTINGQKVNLDTLKVAYLNALFRGKAVFRIGENGKDVNP